MRFSPLYYGHASSHKQGCVLTKFERDVFCRARLYHMSPHKLRTPKTQADPAFFKDFWLMQVKSLK